MAEKANRLKEEGNRFFAKGAFNEAWARYTHAINADPKNPKLYTNRAMTHCKLSAWEDCIVDCLQALELDKTNMKASYYIAQAQLALDRPSEAYVAALTAYERCLATEDRSLQSVSTLVLETKKAKWAAQEQSRLRTRADLLVDLEAALVQSRDSDMTAFALRKADMDPKQYEEERDCILQKHRIKLEELRSVFALADPENHARKEVPEHFIDSVTFSVMHDPYITKSGVSYEYATLVEHLKRSNEDPLTREPMTLNDLRPNRNLKAACEAYLEENGWAVDW